MLSLQLLLLRVSLAAAHYLVRHLHHVLLHWDFWLDQTCAQRSRMHRSAVAAHGVGALIGVILHHLLRLLHLLHLRSSSKPTQRVETPGCGKNRSSSWVTKGKRYFCFFFELVSAAYIAWYLLRCKMLLLDEVDYYIIRKRTLQIAGNQPKRVRSRKSPNATGQGRTIDDVSTSSISPLASCTFGLPRVRALIAELSKNVWIKPGQRTCAL